MKFSIKDFFIKCDQIRRKLRKWSHLMKKPLMENFIFCVVYTLDAFDYQSRCHDGKKVRIRLQVTLFNQKEGMK